MPAKNSLKQYLENGYYHLYNRGVEKRDIFIDQQDYGVFLSYLKEYLLPKDEEQLRKKLDSDISYQEKDKILKLLRLRNFSDEITLLSYSLMPNHFHFLIKQTLFDAIDRFLSSLCTRYSMYFNRKYKRVGSLYQGVYKAILVSSDEQLVHLSRYIHKQALALQGETLRGRQPCSYDEYLGKRHTEWVKPQAIINYFSKTNPRLSYETFVRGQIEIDRIYKLILEDL